MLKALRKKMRGILIGTIILIIPAFIGFYGMRGSRQKESQPRVVVVAKVNGQIIEEWQLDSACQEVRRKWRSQYWNEQMERQLRKGVLEEFIKEILIFQEAKKGRIKVTDQEVLNEISSIPILQKDGKFNKELYLRFLRYEGISPERFEGQLRDELMVKKLINQVMEGAEISEEELREEYIKKNEKVRVKYLLFNKEDFKKDLKVEEKELKDYLEENREEFKVPEKVNVQYVLIDSKEKESQVEIDDHEIASYYQENIEKYKHEEGGEAYTDSLKEVSSQIQANLKAERADEMAGEEAEDLANELLDKSDWDRMVKEKKLEVKETGFFARGEAIKGIGWAPQFSREVFVLEEDEVSQSVKTPQGYAIFVLKERRASHLPELEEVREKVEKKFKDRKAAQLAKRKAEECLGKLREGVTFEEVAQEFSLEVKDSGLFSRGQYIEGIGPSPDFSEAAFSLKEADVSDPVETRLGFCLLQLEERQGIDEEKYNEEKEEFREEELLPRKKWEAYQKWYQSLRSQAEVWTNPEIVK